MSWVIDNSKQKGNAFVVLLMIANHAHSDGTGAWPSLITLAREARISRRTVWASILTLEKSGELKVARGRGRNLVNHYVVTMKKKVQELHHLEKVQTADQKGAIHADKRCKAIAPEPSLNRPVIQPSRTAQKLRVTSPPISKAEHQRRIEAQNTREWKEEEVRRESHVGTGPVVNDLMREIGILARKKAM